jgi:HAD superfamily hydrolase (TIGR01509 family)
MKAIFFDASGIIFYRVDKHRAIRALLERYKVPMARSGTMRNATKPVRTRAFCGQASHEEWYDAVLAAWGLADPTLREEGHQALAADAADITLFDGVPETLQALHDRGFKLGIVSNTAYSTEETLEWFRSRGLTIAWDAFADSMEVGAVKPDPLIYQAALDQCGLTVADVVFVSHNNKDIGGALALGMTTVAFNHDEDVQADYYIDQFVDLLDLPFLQTPSENLVKETTG